MDKPIVNRVSNSPLITINLEEIRLEGVRCFFDLKSLLDKGIILLLQEQIEGIIPFGRQTKKQRKEITQKYDVGQKISGSVMEVKPENKKVILFSDELSDKNIQKDEIKDFLDNQEQPIGERIEIPENISDDVKSDPESDSVSN